MYEKGYVMTSRSQYYGIGFTVQQNLGHVLSLGFWLSDFIRWLSKPPRRPFFRCENSFGVGRIFFLKSELFRCEKVQKGLIQPGRHLRNVFGLQLF